MKNYSVRPYRSGEEEEIVQLLQLVFEGWPHFDVGCNLLDHWRWKWIDNPLKSGINVVGVSDDKIIGCAHRVPKRIKIGDSVFLGMHAGDVAVHPDFRGMGVYTKMDELARELEVESGIDYFYGVTDNPILMEYYRHKRPFRVIFSDDDVIAFRFDRISDIDQHLRVMRTKKAVLYKYGFHMFKTVNKLRNALSLRARAKVFAIRDIRSFDDRMNVFWNEIKDHYIYIVKRTKDYLNWRYCDPRGGDYLIKTAEKDGRILGYIVLRINKYRKDYPEGYIVDLLTLHDRVDVASALVKDAGRYFDAQHVNVVRCQVVRNHPHESLFRRHGFLNSRYRIYSRGEPNATLARPRLDEELKKVPQVTQEDSSGKVHFVYGDYDNI